MLKRGEAVRGQPQTLRGRAGSPIEFAAVIAAIARLLRAAANATEGLGARRQVSHAPSDIEAAYDFIASFEYGNVRLAPVQVREEMLTFLKRLAESPPRSIVELGTARGGDPLLVHPVAAHDATIVTVDLGHGPFGGGYRRAHAPLLKGFARDRQSIHLVRGDTHARETLDRVQSIVGRRVDLLFIDGDHTYEGVRHDFENVRPPCAIWAVWWRSTTSWKGRLRQLAAYPFLAGDQGSRRVPGDHRRPGTGWVRDRCPDPSLTRGQGGTSGHGP